jgi:nicotinamidase-related amidase
MTTSRKALIVLDFINEIVHPDGKFNAKGYPNFIQQNNVIQNLNFAIKKAREQDFLIIFVRVGFSEDYINQPKNSVLFCKANEFQALQLNTWATEIHSGVDFQDTDILVTKHRISPYFGTPLEVYLRNNKVEDVFLCGVATDLVVESAARDSHDRDYNVFVISDCCGAGSDEEHENGIKTSAKISNICLSNDL